LEPSRDGRADVAVTIAGTNAVESASQAPTAATSLATEPALVRSGVLGGQVEISISFLDGAKPFRIARDTIKQDSIAQREVLSVDLALCIAGRPENSVCELFVDVRLLDGSGTPYDSARVGPLNAVQGSLVDAPPIEFRPAVSLQPVDSLVRVKLGQRVTARVNAIDASGRPMAGRSISWRSVDPAVATVDEYGQVTGVALGRTTIQATYNSLTTSFAVKVPIVESFTASSPKVRVIATVPTQMNVTIGVRPGFSTAVKYRSSNVAVASVDSTGKISTFTGGTATISAIALADTTESVALPIVVDPYQAIASVEREITGAQGPLPGLAYTVWGTRSDSLVAGGCNFLSRFDGTSWRLEQPTTFCTFAITGESMQNLWAIGNQIWNFNGTTWTRQPVTLARSLFAASTKGQVTYAVGDNGYILRRDASGWQPMTSPTANALRAVAALSATEAFAVGDSGTVLRLQNGTWSVVNIGSIVNFSSVIVRSGTEVYIAGSRNNPYVVEYFRFNGSTWQSMTFAVGEGPAALVDDGSSIFSVGYNGMILRLNNGAWVSDFAYAGLTYLRAGFGDAGATVLVGESGVSYVKRGGNWSAINQVPTYYALWAASPSFIVAGGVRGSIDLFNGTSWTSMRGDNSQGLLDIWGTSAQDVWAVGTAGTLLHYQGSTWQAVASGVASSLFGVWGVSRDTIWAVADGGQIIRYNGTTWQTVFTGGAAFRGIGGADARSVYAVGDGGQVRRFNGATWVPELSGTTSRLWSVYAADSANVVVVGDSAIIRRVNGTWRNETPSLTNSPGQIATGFRRVVGTSARDVYAVGCGSSAYRFDGAVWREFATSAVIGCVYSGQLVPGGGGLFGGALRTISIGVGPLGTRPGSRP
jgi:hypothetical protein